MRDQWSRAFEVDFAICGELLLAAFGLVNGRGCLCWCELVSAIGYAGELGVMADPLQESVSTRCSMGKELT